MPYGNKTCTVKKWKANTHQDRRYTRANRVTMTACPICTRKTLLEMTNQGYVWVRCSSCSNSGESEAIKDNHLMDVCDVVATLIDAVMG